MVPSSPAGAGRNLWLHHTILSSLSLHCQGGGGQDSSQSGFTKSQGQPLFHEIIDCCQIHTILASLHQQGNREAKDGERCLDLLASFWASYKTKVIAAAREQKQQQICHKSCKYFACRSVLFNKPISLQLTKPHHRN